MRGEHLYAVKVLDTLELNGWARRELVAMLRLELDNVVRLKSFDWWPDAECGYPCIIMEFVPGLPLDAWALRYNPSLRAVLRVLLKVVQALREVFRRGVLHRDVKPSNILLREDDGEPVLIDFGFSSVTGAPTETGPVGVPPGTPEYRAPEAMRFLSGRAEDYAYSLSDELWAVGVTLYWLLTDELPFGGREELGLNARVRLDTPRAPHVLNPRVPEAVSALCLRMLEKDPLARFQDHDELCDALEALLAGATGDANWDVPLMDPTSPDVDAPMVEEEVRRKMAYKPRRGRWAVNAVGPRWGRGRSALSLVAALAVVVLAVGLVGVRDGPAPAATPPAASARGEATAQATPVREVARPGDSPQADAGAVPVRAQPPAPSPTAMLRKSAKTPKPQEKPTPQPGDTASRCVPIRKEVCVAGVCSILLTGCPGAHAPQVRTTPGSIECPAGWEETHAKFGIRGRGNVFLQGYTGMSGETATVQEGPITVEVTSIGNLPRRTLLSGTLQFGEGRFFGAFTQAQTPDKNIYPVCVGVYRDTPTSDCPVGVGDCPEPGSTPGNFKIYTRFPIFSVV